MVYWAVAPSYADILAGFYGRGQVALGLLYRLGKG